MGATPFGAKLLPTQPAGNAAIMASTRPNRFLGLFMLPRHQIENTGLAPILAFPYS
jgi:hypothetical protein